MELFPFFGRAPDGQALLTQFRRWSYQSWRKRTNRRRAIVAQVHREMAPLLRLRKEPVFSNP